ncbi:MAG: SCO family protein, partial [Leptospira sp.]|nr:SCO family protein [Leptospira sp.]
MKMKSVFLTVLLFFFITCEEKKPTFYPELTTASVPKEGILPFFKGEVMDPYWPERGKFPEDLRKIPAFSLISHTNQEVKSQMLLGKYKLITFFYAKCNGICPMITRNMMSFLPKIENQSDLQI